ncbi:hypothetical protein HPB48_001600 [Haemaphysalis longicornis]|uniref:Uncharacterized protein n=1 Tax=Haemaphysalis longicornis TaxID=44386 RepID=A0A9J6GL59_HAELO|nr:hypothetical protein HPB48_001600 [Haemaphysalis longicornis]
MSESRLEDIYWNFPDGNDDSYVTHWVHAKRNASRLVAKNVYHELSRLPHFYYDVPIAYDLQHNTMTISATALTQPLHFIDGTEGMLYAGLGSMLAANALRLLTWSGVKPGDGHSSAREFQMSGASTFSSQVVSQREALQILHAAYTEAVDGTGQTLASFRNFTANQVFFLVWCYTNCFLTDFQSHNICDDVVAGYEPFFAAFRCGHN